MALAHDVLTGASAQSGWGLVFIHGILGSRNNWRSFARRALERDPRWSAVLLDLRNHGESHGLPAPHDLAACADDVATLLRTLGLTRAVLVGHSFGGKVVLELAKAGHDGLDAVWVLDAPPGLRALGRGLEEIDRVLEAVGAVPLPIAHRRALVEALTARGLSEPLAQWMTTNLRAAPAGGLEWKFALSLIPEMLTSFAVTDEWPYLEAHRGAPALHLVRGDRGDRWSSDEWARVERAAAAGRLTAHRMADAGHWLHTDDPDTLLGMLLPTLGE